MALSRSIIFCIDRIDAKCGRSDAATNEKASQIARRGFASASGLQPDEASFRRSMSAAGRLPIHSPNLKA